MPGRGPLIPMLALATLLAACASGGRTASPQQEVPMTIQLTSPAFNDGAQIPAKHTCDDRDLSPPLQWSGVPAGTKSLALIADDPDAPAGTWTHWVLFNLPPTATELSEGVPATETLPGGGSHGRNDFRRMGYGGPCPPRGSPHRYYFRLYALDTTLPLQPGASKADVLKATQGHVLAQGQLMGTYRRK